MIILDPGSSVPPFEQLRSGIAERIRDGRLPAGTKLPPVRRLAQTLDLAPNTVARAYRELETAGLVATAGRRGTVVAADGDSVTRAAAAAAAEFADTVHRLGLPTPDGVALARAALEAREPREADGDDPGDVAPDDDPDPVRQVGIDLGADPPNGVRPRARA